MTQDKRKFTALISVKTDTRRVKLELSPAELYGGQPGLVRVRMGRRWLDGYFCHENIAKLVAQQLAGGQPAKSATVPEIPLNAYISVPFPNAERRQLTRTSSAAPVRLFDGHYYVMAYVIGKGQMLFRVDEIIIKTREEALRERFCK